MPTAQNPPTGNQNYQPKPGRKPLQPKNVSANSNVDSTPPKPKPSKPDWIEIDPIRDSDKENHPIYLTPTKIETFDASLAEELSAIRKKLERLRLDKESTEKKLKERDLMLEAWMKDLEQRSEAQKELEIEVDRLFRLKEFKASCVRVSPIKSLREKEGEKKVKETQSQDVKAEEKEECVDENTVKTEDGEESVDKNTVKIEGKEESVDGNTVKAEGKGEFVDEQSSSI